MARSFNLWDRHGMRHLIEIRHVGFMRGFVIWDNGDPRDDLEPKHRPGGFKTVHEAESVIRRDLTDLGARGAFQRKS